MPHSHSPASLKKRSKKIAFLIDCVDGIDGASITSSLIEQFPSYSDIFLFYHRNEPEMLRRLKYLKRHLHGVFCLPTTLDGIMMNISFSLGHLADQYENFIVLTATHSAFEDICAQLIHEHPKLTNHIQFRSFERIHEFEQFLEELTRLHSEKSIDTTAETHVVHYDRNSLFHSCPFETVEQSSIVYRFAELLHHLETEHEDVTFEYCRECQQMVNEKNQNTVYRFEKHIQDEHWDDDKGFQLSMSISKSEQ